MPTPFTIRNSQVFEMESAAVGDTFKIYVRLPEGYTTEGSRYPVLLALDGDAAFGLMADTLSLLEMEQRIPPTILVSPGYGISLLNEHHPRSRDYVPTEAEAPTPSGEMTRLGGGAANFLRFLREELLPRIDADFHTDPQRRTFAGISFGGLFGTYTLFHQPDTFWRYVIASPSLWWDNRHAFSYLETYRADDLPTRVFFTVGQEEAGEPINMVADLRDFVTGLQKRAFPGLQMKHVELYGGHVSSQPGAMVQGLSYLFEGWQPPKP